MPVRVRSMEGLGIGLERASDWAELLSQAARFVSDRGSGVQGCLSFNEHDVTLLLGNGIVTNAFGHYECLTSIEFDSSVFHLDSQRAAKDVEQFVLVVVAVPRERAFDFGYLHERVVQLRDNSGRPMLCKRSSEFLGRDNIRHR